MEDLSKVIYRCPLCSTFESLILTPNTGECSKCGASIEIDKRYHLHCKNEECELEGSLEEIYQNLRIRRDELEGLADRDLPGELEALCLDNEQIITFSEDVTLSAESFPGMEILFKGRMMLTWKRLVFTKDSEFCSIPLEAVSSVTIEGNTKLQVYDSSKEKLYQLVFGRESVLKWQDLIAAVIEKEFGHIPNLR